MTIVSLVLLAAIDSINPSAIVVTLYLLSRSEASVQVGVYIAAIFLTYFALGLLMILGIDTFLPSIGPLLRTPPGLVAQVLVGLALLVYSLTAPGDRTSATPVTPPSARTYVGLAMLGVSVTAMELPTALPYFGAVAVITGADLPIWQSTPLLGIYNAIFVLPPVILLIGSLLFGQHVGERYAGLRVRLQQGARETALWIAGLVGGGLFVTGAIELVARFR
jgi:cytochrome c biogenesis protein CcdA